MKIFHEKVRQDATEEDDEDGSSHSLSLTRSDTTISRYPEIFSL